MMDLSYLTPRLRQNKETSLRIVLTPRISSAAMAEWISALQVNESVRQVELLCSGPFVQSATPSLWQALLGAVLGLPNLERFQMRGCSTASTYNQDDCSIPVKALTALRSTSLSLFSLSQLVLCGSPMDFACLASAFCVQKSLREFQWISVGLLQTATSAEEDITTSVLEPLLNTLAELPKLENLEVSGTFTPLGVLEEAPHSLFRSKSLKRLSVSDFIFPEAALASIWDHLSKNFQLQELAVSGSLTAKVAPKLTRLLSHNKTLEAIALRVDSFDDEVCNQELATAIGSSHLQVVSLCSFFGGPVSPQTRKVFSKMLETNCSLEYLYLPVPYTDTTFWNNVRLYLGLNCAGRKNVTKKLVIDSQEETSSRSSFYWMANKNASSCTTATAILTPKRSAKPNVTVSLVDACGVSISPGKRHQRMIEARATKKRRFPVVPTKGLSSMFIR